MNGIMQQFSNTRKLQQFQSSLDDQLLSIDYNNKY